MHTRNIAVHQRTTSTTPVAFGPVAFKMALTFCVLCFTGCNTFGLGSGKLVEELRIENERLLAEFRAERDRREGTEKELRTLENRLAESEKLLARQASPGGGRVTQLPPVGGFGGGYVQPFSADLPGNRSGLNQGAPGVNAFSDPESGLRWQRRVSR